MDIVAICEAAKLLEISKGTVAIEDRTDVALDWFVTDVVCDKVVIAVEECDDVVAFENNTLLLDGPEVVP